MYLLPSNLVNVITCWIDLQITIALYARKGLTKKTNDVRKKVEALKIYIRKQINQWVVVALCLLKQIQRDSDKTQLCEQFVRFLSQ